ncbi:MAG: IS1634 family transposase, partial [ANME-2 cluster archaeon]|nr:IS1634 family transposase [ANME-2 cluster archaeon]
MVIKRKKKNGRVYLEEYKSIRVDGKVKSIYVRSLGSEEPVAPSKPKTLDRLEHSRSHRAGAVTLLWELASQLGFVNIIDEICCGEPNMEGPTPGKLLTAWAINRVLDPMSNTMLENWIPTTDLPRLMDLSPADLTRNSFLTAMDFVCYDDKTIGQIHDFTQQIDDALYQQWRKTHPLKPGETETVAYDLTSVLFFGISCSLAELGYNAKHVRRLQVNLALLVSKFDKYPISHFVYNGSRNSLSTIRNLVTQLKDTGIEPGTIIWDRGNVSKEHVNMIESAGWKLICGIPKTLKEVKNIIDSMDVPLNPLTFVHKSRTGHIYAIRTRDQLFGKERSVVIYTNQERRTSKINAQNEVLADIGQHLNALSEEGNDWSEAHLHKAIKTIVGSWEDYVFTRVKRKGNGPRIEWKYKSQEIAAAERSHGKYLLFSTDESLSPDEVVKAYFEKDFVEKVFRTLKTSEEMEPVRHRLERRVRVYIFVCVLAYRLLADLQWRLQKLSDRKNVWHEADAFLYDLERVERVQVRLGHQVKILHLNL